MLQDFDMLLYSSTHAGEMVKSDIKKNVQDVTKGFFRALV